MSETDAPPPEEEQPRPSRAGLRVLYHEVRQYVPGRRRYVQLAVTAVLASVAEAISLVLLTLSAATLAQDSVDSKILGISLSRPAMISGAAISLALRLLLMWLNTRNVVSMATDAMLASRHRILSAFVATSFERQSRESPGVLQEMFTGRADAVAGSFTLLAGVAVSGVNLLVLTVAALVLQPLAVLGLGVIATAMVFALRPFNDRIRALAHEAITASEQLVRRLSDLTNNYRDISAYGVGTQFVEAMQPAQTRAADLFRQSSTLSGFIPHVYQTLGLGLAVGGLAVTAALGQDQVTVLGAIVLLLLRSVSYGQQILSTSQRASERIPWVTSISTTLADFESYRRPAGGTRPTRVDDIVLTDVEYRYQEGPLVLQGVSLDIAPGEMVGIVGPSGGGKSTLLQILCGLRTPTAGHFEVGGIAQEEIDPMWWAEHVALVPQDSRLLEATLAENVAFFREIGADRIEAASREAQLGQDLEQLGGLDSNLSYQGRSLSGGQIQRLAIARALAGSPELLLLDEPTSALDIGTEQRLQAVLDELHGHITMVIVAHRLSTVAVCDRVLVVQGGRIIAHGPAQRVLDEFGRAALADWDMLDGE